MDPERLAKYKRAPMLLSPLIHSTTTVKAELYPLSFNEEYLIEHLEVNETIRKIDCNYGHLEYKTEEQKAEEEAKKQLPPAPPAVRRGRKKREKPVKPRRVRGDGTSFNSQITLEIRGSYMRPYLEGDEYRPNLVDSITNPGMKEIHTTYKIKLFRNGLVTIPGVSMEDLEDVKGPLQTLCDYMSEHVEDPDVADSRIQYRKLEGVMYNFKCHMSQYNVDLGKLIEYCETLTKGRVLINYKDLVGFLVNPQFMETASPIHVGWNHYFSNVGAPPMFIPSKQDILNYLANSTQTKNLRIHPADMYRLISELPLLHYYEKLFKLSNAARGLGSKALSRILYYWMEELFTQMQSVMMDADDNFINRVKYDSESYPVVLLRFKTPIPGKDLKKTTVKVYTPCKEYNQKINIDGANSREEAEYIYYWFNWHIQQRHAEIIYKPGEYPEIDSDFSYTDSEMSDEDEDVDGDADSDAEVFEEDDTAEHDAISDDYDDDNEL
jgi:hypothetical protein